jgi:hypothetical protein
MVPLLNYTDLNQTIDNINLNGWRNKKNQVRARFFPRWNALSKLVNPKTNKQTSAIMVAGDSELEN